MSSCVWTFELKDDKYPRRVLEITILELFTNKEPFKIKLADKIGLVVKVFWPDILV